MCRWFIRLQNFSQILKLQTPNLDNHIYLLLVGADDEQPGGGCGGARHVRRGHPGLRLRQPRRHPQRPAQAGPGSRGQEQRRGGARQEQDRAHAGQPLLRFSY